MARLCPLRFHEWGIGFDKHDKVDHYAENEYWSPCNGGFNLSTIPAGDYPELKAHSVSAFENSCKLSVILNDIICQLYVRRRLEDIEEASKCIRAKLDDWRERSPSHLELDADDLPEICPPPHILTQKSVHMTPC